METWAVDINTDTNYRKTTHSDMASSSSLNMDVIMALGGEVQSSYIQMGPAAVWSIDPHMATGGGPDPGHLHGL